VSVWKREKNKIMQIISLALVKLEIHEFVVMARRLVRMG
jgi:hypothetical protein